MIDRRVFKKPRFLVIGNTHGERPKTVLADAGYRNEDDLEALEACGVDGYVALGREGPSAVAVDEAKHQATARMAEKLANSP